MRQKQAEDMNRPAKTDGLRVVDDGQYGQRVNEYGLIWFYIGVTQVLLKETGVLNMVLTGF